MTQAVRVYKPVSDETVNDTQLDTQYKDNLFDIKTGEALLDVKKIRVKIASEESAAIALLQQYYSEKLGKEITLSQLIHILVQRDINDKFSLDFSAIRTALESALKSTQVKLPSIKLGGE